MLLAFQRRPILTFSRLPVAATASFRYAGTRVSSAVAKPISRKRTPSPPLTDKAYFAIKTEILSNRLEPGAVLPIQRFTGEMKLSRTPVREAILRLQREGFVEIRPRLGTIVAHLDLTRLREMYQVRSILEGEAAKLASAALSD